MDQDLHISHVHTENDFKAVRWNTNIYSVSILYSVNIYFSARQAKSCSVCLCDSARLCKQQKSVLITTHPFLANQKCSLAHCLLHVLLICWHDIMSLEGRVLLKGHVIEGIWVV